MTDTPQNHDASSSGPKKYRLDDPNNADKIYWLVIAICALLFVADLFYHKHPYFEVEGGFADLVDLRIEMEASSRQEMHDERSYETYRPFLSATVTSSGDPDGVLLDLPSGGRIRPKGQSTLYFGTCMDRTVPYSVDFDRGSDPSQTLFGVQRAYLRTHVGDGSHSREWAMHRMLARFGLPHLRTRTVRLFLNGEYEGLYDVVEAPDQEHVFQRSFPGFDPEEYGLYKVKTLSLGCGNDDDPGFTLALAGAEKRIDDLDTPPYRFERGEHRPIISVKEGDWIGCSFDFFTNIQKYSSYRSCLSISLTSLSIIAVAPQTR